MAELNQFDRIANELAQRLKSEADRAHRESANVTPFGQQRMSPDELRKAWPTMTGEQRMEAIQQSGPENILKALRG